VVLHQQEVLSSSTVVAPAEKEVEARKEQSESDDDMDFGLFD
jgi:ribosomal protein L12E/L44/L45/RPP1/RPP2